MNKQRILDLADYIEKSDTYCQFDWFHNNDSEHPCGTPSCVAGHLFAMDGGEDTGDHWIMKDETGKVRYWSVKQYLQKTLDLSHIDTGRLTKACVFSLSNDSPTPEQTAWTLRNLAHTGEIVWRRDLPQEAPVIETTEITETKTQMENLNAPVLHK